MFGCPFVDTSVSDAGGFCDDGCPSVFWGSFPDGVLICVACFLEDVAGVALSVAIELCLEVSIASVSAFVQGVSGFRKIAFTGTETFETCCYACYNCCTARTS